MIRKAILIMGIAAFFCKQSHCAFNGQFIIEAANEHFPVDKENIAHIGRDAKSHKIGPMLPAVINTWNFINATKKAWMVLSVNRETALNAVEQGCTVCEEEQCDFTVGYGGSPDENGETTLDAMIMDGPSHRSGAVAGLRRIKKAISVARKVMEHTDHTLLVGEWATQFAIQMGFNEDNLTTLNSNKVWQDWKRKGCQPNFWMNVQPDSESHCGPYTPVNAASLQFNKNDAPKSHDTIGMVAVDNEGNIASGTSTNGARFKIPGRVGDAPITGSGSYVDQTVGGAAATGDGDVLMRFLPSLMTVEYMRNGMTPSSAAAYSLKRIADYYPKFEGAIVAMRVNGEFGAACHGFEKFAYSVANPDMIVPQIISVECVSPKKSSQNLVP